MKRNITLSLSKSLLQKAKLEAVRKDQSLSEFMREALEEKISKNTGYKKAKERQLRLLNKGLNLGTRGKIKITREELHERR